MIVERLAELQHANDLRAQQRTVDAVALVRSAKSTQTMESLHALLVQMHAVVDRRIDAQLRAANGRLFEDQGQLLAATVVDLLLLAALFVLIWHAFAARERHLRREREAHKQAEAASVLRDQFLSVASHELRTPITTLLPTVQLLEGRLSPTIQADDRLRQSFAAIDRQVVRLQALIATILDVSCIQCGQLRIFHAPLGLSA